MFEKRSFTFLAPSILLVCASLFSGCAGSSLTKIEKTTELPKELSKDMQEKFEVRDVSQLAQPTPTPSETPAPVANAKGVKLGLANPSKKGKGKKAALTAAAEPKKFVYLNRRPEKDPIWVGEKLTYEVTYLGMPAGTFVLEALPYKVVGSRKVYHILATAKSSAVFSLIYKLEDSVQTFIDYEGIFSHRFHLQQDETKQIRDSLELYDSEKGQTFWWNRWNRKEKGYFENKEFFPMEPFPQDSLSSLYFLRTVQLPPGITVKFPVMSEGKPLDAYVTVVKREEMDTPIGTKVVVKLKPEAATRGVLERKGDSFIWMTDDDRRFLVRLEAKVKIGTVVVNLKKVELGTSP